VKFFTSSPGATSWSATHSRYRLGGDPAAPAVGHANVRFGSSANLASDSSPSPLLVLVGPVSCFVFRRRRCAYLGEAADRAANAVGCPGTLRFDASKPEGKPRKLLDSSRLIELGWRPLRNLRAGTEKVPTRTTVIAWRHLPSRCGRCPREATDAVEAVRLLPMRAARRGVPRGNAIGRL